jgi:hydrogenase maturation protease
VATRILCLGNELVGDDGIGIRVGRVLCAVVLPVGMTVEFRHNLGFDLLEWLAEPADRLVLVDAMSTGTTPGTCHVFRVSDLSAPTSSVRTCSHVVGIAGVLETAQHLWPDRVDASLTIVGIEIERADEYTTCLTAAVRAALPHAVDQVLLAVSASHHLRGQARAACESWMQRDPTAREACAEIAVSKS